MITFSLKSNSPPIFNNKKIMETMTVIRPGFGLQVNNNKQTYMTANF